MCRRPEQTDPPALTVHETITPIVDLSGKVAVVTGAASGIGRASAVQMARAGAAVAIADINGPGAEEVARGIRDAGGDALAVTTDVAQPRQVAGMIERVTSRYGALHILCNNAADLSLLEGDRDLLETDIETWDRTWEADLRSVMVACKYALPHMLAAGGGAIVNVSSVDGVSGDNTRFAYAAAKAGINVLTQSTAVVYGRQGVRCNAVLPGLVLSPAAAETLEAHPAIGEIFHDNVLTPHLGTPDEIASVIVFLASDSASYVNGQLIRVDGGLLSHVPHLAQFENYFASLAPAVKAPGDGTTDA